MFGRACLRWGGKTLDRGGRAEGVCADRCEGRCVGRVEPLSAHLFRQTTVGAALGELPHEQPKQHVVRLREGGRGGGMWSDCEEGGVRL